MINAIEIKGHLVFSGTAKLWFTGCNLQFMHIIKIIAPIVKDQKKFIQ